MQTVNAFFLKWANTYETNRWGGGGTCILLMTRTSIYIILC